MSRATACSPARTTTPSSRPRIAVSTVGGQTRAYLYDRASGMWTRDDGASIADWQLRALATAPGQEVTFTAVPPGSGFRIAQTR